MARWDGIDARLGGWVARRLLGALGEPGFRIELWTGEAVGARPESARATVRLRDAAAFRRLLLDPELQFGELYTQGRLEIEGDLVALLDAVFRAGLHGGGARRLLPRLLREGVLRTDEGRAARNARHHYDVGNAFYELWLDEAMVYTCAYFPRPELSLEDAQVAKMDHVAQKIALRPEERVIEAGCGWGSLALHMARWYGARVRAFNVSREQVLYAREQAEKQGLSDRVEFIEDDYRNATGRCDAFVSVGMLEHVGPDHYDDLGRVIDRCLVPEGRGLLHTIGRAKPVKLNRWIRRRVFPNAHPPTLSEMMQVLEPFDLAVLDAENLRLHYARTAAHWLERFERSYEQIEAMVGRERARTWRLYLAGTVASFEAGLLQLYQATFARAASKRIPWTRAYLYTGEREGFGPNAGPASSRAAETESHGPL